MTALARRARMRLLARQGKLSAMQADDEPKSVLFLATMAITPSHEQPGINGSRDNRAPQGDQKIRVHADTAIERRMQSSGSAARAASTKGCPDIAPR